MFPKILALCAIAAVARAGLLPSSGHYSSATAVSSQSIIRHDESHGARLAAAPVAKLAVAAPIAYHAAPAVHYSPAHSVSSQSIQRHAAPTPFYHAAPAPVYRTASVAHYAAPVSHQVEEYAHPKYDFSYSVADAHTGDNKSQSESRDGDAVHGSYSLHEADGSIRTVQYSADDHSGFNAVVHNTAPTHAPVLVKAAIPQYYHH